MKAFKLASPTLVENDVERQCLDFLRLRGYWPVRLHAGTFKSLDGKRHIKGVEKGTPDYAVLHGYRVAFLLEVKRPGGVLSPEQVAKMNELELWPLVVVAVDSVAALKQWLDKREERA